MAVGVVAGDLVITLVGVIIVGIVGTEQARSLAGVKVIRVVAGDLIIVKIVSVKSLKSLVGVKVIKAIAVDLAKGLIKFIVIN